MIKTVWDNCNNHKKGEEICGVIFGNKIGWEDGGVDEIDNIAACMFNNLCATYLIHE